MCASQRELAVPPPAFAAQVKDALEHLYDLVYLQQHPLVQEGKLAYGAPHGLAGQHLRQALVEAIEALSPGENVPFRASPARLRNILALHYIEGQTIGATAHELGISYRQALRDLRRGEESVALILWSRCRATGEPDASAVSSFEAEMAQLRHEVQPCDPLALLQCAQEAVKAQAEQRGVILHLESPKEPAMIPTDPVVGQQVLVSLLSHAVGQAEPGILRLTLETGHERALLHLRYVPRAKAVDAPVDDTIVMQLIDRLGWSVWQRQGSDGTRVASLEIKARGPVVLIIDDNEGLVDLLKRCLTMQGCRVMGVRSGQEGLRLAQEVLPDVIILDVMMPGVHGWEILQKLHNTPETAKIPVVVCTVLNNPQLAYSLGATLFLAKPVSREDILGALHKLDLL
jgi:CheY-like chemotaxis protein